MNTITYFLEANVALAIVTVFYYAVLKNETNFQFQRLFILCGIICSLVFPFIQIESRASLPSMSELTTLTLPDLIVMDQQPFFHVDNLLAFVYVAVCSLILLRLFWNFSRLIKLWWANKKTKTSGRSEIGSFSFLNLIFIDHSYSREEREMILKHEQIHARLFHSADIILLELLKVFFWFNPFVYILRKQITNIHEFQADELAVKGADAEQYCSLLARVALQSADFPIANHFNNSLTLTRIVMITKEKVKLSRWKVFASAAVMVALFVFISCKEQDLRGKDAVVESDVNAKNGQVFSVVQEAAQPADGIPAFYKSLAREITYPKEARSKKIEGKVFVEFIVNLDGSLSDFKVVRGIGDSCDEEAIRALKAVSLKWNPAKQDGASVRQRIVIPINFRIEDGISHVNKDVTIEIADQPNTKFLNEVVVAAIVN